jgi:hypothetical protein
MRRKAAPSMMQGAPSADPPEASPRPTAPPCRQMGSSKASPGPRKPCGRTSTMGPPASDPRLIRSACNGKQHHRPWRSSRGRKREGQTTDAIDTKVRESQSRGCSQALLYNTRRPHMALANRAPMAVWREGVTGVLDGTAVDMTLRLDNAGALPTCPQPQQQPKRMIA